MQWPLEFLQGVSFATACFLCRIVRVAITHLRQASCFITAAAGAAADRTESSSQSPKPLAAGEQLSSDPLDGCARRRTGPLESATFAATVAARGRGNAPKAAEPTHKQGVELCEVDLRCVDRVCGTAKGGDVPDHKMRIPLH